MNAGLNRQASTASFETPREAARGAFTVVELLVVIVIITLLLTAVVTVGKSVISKGQVRDTESMLRVVRQAVDQFAGQAPLTSVRQRRPNGEWLRYTDRYGEYPPDELELFTGVGLPGSEPAAGTLAPGAAVVVPTADDATPYPAMQFYTRNQPLNVVAREHRDLAAMVLSIRLFSDTASAVLDRVPEQYWSQGAIDADGVPQQYLDRPPKGDFRAEEDEPVSYLVDAWQVPLAYFAQRDWVIDSPRNIVSTNHPQWNHVSTELIALNGGAPIIMSYGPNGRDQLTVENVGSVMVVDWLDNPNDVRIDNPLNDDNVYAEPTLRDALARGRGQ